jgi:FMN-dependent NADH-azoreductase
VFKIAIANLMRDSSYRKGLSKMSKTLLHIDASARTEGSTTRSLSASVVARLAPARTIRRDLASPLPLIDEAWVGANFTPADQRDAVQRDILALSDQLVQELIEADTIVIGAPVYNFSVPASLKAWIDLVARAGLTFSYTETGPKGLLDGKRAIVVLASGGTPIGSEVDFASGYITHVLGFLGITDVVVIAADSMAVDPEAALTKAESAITQLAA